jgi:ABC-type spermidine/putrescine transport system permease subunit II
MAEEMLMRSGLFSGLFNSAETWVAVAYVLGMFAVLAFRSQQIARPYTFRLSYIFFALYFIVPSAITGIIYLSLMDSNGMGGGRGGSFSLIGMQLCSILGRILLGLSIVLALGSLKRHTGTGDVD